MHDDEKTTVIRTLLREPLNAACFVAGYPNDRRDDLLKQLTEELLNPQRSLGGTWAAKVNAERVVGPVSNPTHLPMSKWEKLELPKVAPATWKKDRLITDKPPDFIKRHYGPWLRADDWVDAPRFEEIRPFTLYGIGQLVKKKKLYAIRLSGSKCRRSDRCSAKCDRL